MLHVRSCALRGRADGAWYASPHSQRLEIGEDASNALSCIAKDFLAFLEYV